MGGPNSYDDSNSSNNSPSNGRESLINRNQGLGMGIKPEHLKMIANDAEMAQAQAQYAS